MDAPIRRPTAQARELCNNATAAERALWLRLSAQKVAGVRFNQQVPIGPYIRDFVSRSARLVVEIDGGQHGRQMEEDAARARYIETQGFRVIRFWNNDVLEGIEGVVSEIERVLGDMPSPDPSRKREGRE